MPEFILDHGSPEASRQFAALDSFTQGYIEAMFFTSTGTGDDEDLEHATVADLSPDALQNIIADCKVFQEAYVDDLARAYDTCIRGNGYDEAMAGRDFWYTRNGHGVGFWDRGLGDVGDRLTELCGWRTPYGEINLYRGGDGLLYLD